MLVFACTFSAIPVSAATATDADCMHARAVESFRLGKFPEAYGRFIPLANAGLPASARYALWKCEQGLPLFGKQAEVWARIAGFARPGAAAHHFVTPTRSARFLGR